MVICSFTKWRVPGDSELQESSTTAALSQKSQQYCLRLQVLSTDKMLEVGKATISGQSIDLMILCSSFCTAWCAKGGCSQPGPAQESLLCAPLPNHTLSDISLVVWSLSRQEYVFTSQKMANATNECPFSESQLFNIYQHVTGDHVSTSEIWVQRAETALFLILCRRNSIASCTNRHLLFSEKNTLHSYSALSFHLLICFLG